MTSEQLQAIRSDFPCPTCGKETNQLFVHVDGLNVSHICIDCIDEREAKRKIARQALEGE